MLKKLGYNDISDKLLKTIPELKPGQSVIYRLLKAEVTGFGPTNEFIPTECQIYDPYKETFVQIAALKGERYNAATQKTDPDFLEIVFQSSSLGTLTFHGNNPDHVKAHQYMWLSDMRVNKEGRNTSIPGVYRLVDTAADAKARNAERKARLTAERMVADMTEDDVFSIAVGSLGADRSLDVEVLRDQLYKLATEKPQRLLDLSKSPDGVIKANIQKFQDAKLIKWVGQANSWKQEDNTLATVERGSKDKVGPLVAYFKDEGAEVYAALVAEISEA